MQTNGSAVTLIDTHTYDALNRLESTTDSGFHTTDYGYDDVGNRAFIVHPNGNVTEYSYDSLNRLTDISVFDGLNVLVEQYSYTLHSTGRREAITELDGRVSSYVYDDLYRLTSETITDAVNGNHSASYDYDAVGNRTQSIINGVTTSYSYDDNDRLSSAGGDSYSYDDNGNTVSQTVAGVTTGYVYDKRNRLVSSSSGGVTISYSYDVDGIRTGRSSGGSSTDFIVDHNREYAQVVAEVTDGDFARGYSFGDDLISQVFPGGSVFFYHYDGLGSTRSLSDATGVFTDGYDYEAFGELLNSTGGTDNSYLFTGEQYDEGLDSYSLRARYYDQGVGRFTQMDSFQGLQNDPVTLHKYLYGNGDPANHIDPTGNIAIANVINFGRALSNFVTVSLQDQNPITAAAGDSLSASQQGLLILAEGNPSIAKMVSRFAEQVNLQNTPQELSMLARKDVLGYYKSRLGRGELYAALALDVVNNQGVLGRVANLWMFTQFTFWNDQKSKHLNDGTYLEFIRMVNVGLASAHATSVDRDPFGVKGLLSSGQIADYHQQYFRSIGFRFDKVAFGGTAFFGYELPLWCRGCDVKP